MKIPPISPARTELARVFIAENGARPDAPLSYRGYYTVGGFEVSYGGKSPIFHNISGHRDAKLDGSVGNEASLVRISLTSYLPIDKSSAIYNQGKRREKFDLQVHFGVCKTPSDYNSFDRAFIIEDCEIESYQTDSLSAMTSGDRDAIRETVDIVGRRIVEVSNICVGGVTELKTSGNIADIDGTRVGHPGRSDDFIYALVPYQNGVNDMLVMFSRNLGVDWYFAESTQFASDNDTNPFMIATQNYLVVFSFSTTVDKTYYITKPAADSWETGEIEFTAGQTFGGTLTFNDGDFHDNIGWTVSAAGAIYKIVENDPNATYPISVTATTDSIGVSGGAPSDVHVGSKSVAIIVGGGGNYAYTRDAGDNWTVSTTTAGDNLLCGYALSRDLFFIGDDQGVISWLRPGNPGGDTWTAVSSAPFSATAINDLHFVGRSVGYAAIACTSGAVARTIDGGYSWRLLDTSTVTETLSVYTPAGIADNVLAGYSGGILQASDCIEFGVVLSTAP